MTGTLVLGVGNTLLADEGAGVHAMHFLEKHYDLPDVLFLDGGTLSFTLAGDIADATNLIIFDAAQMDAEPGHVHVFENTEFDAYLQSGVRSVHEVGFADLMDIARLQECLPKNYALIGIQPEVLGWGNQPGTKVSAAIPEAAASAAALLSRWTTSSDTETVN